MNRFQFLHRLLGRIAEQGRQLVVAPQPPSTGASDIEGLCQAILSEHGEASGIALAFSAHEAYAALDTGYQAKFFEMLADKFGPDHAAIKDAVERYSKNPSDGNAIRLHATAEPKRQELIRRLNRTPNGTARLVRMREDLLPLLKTKSQLAEVDHDFHHLLSSWFNPGFLVLERIDWGSPATILEKIIRYEAVHAIQSWEDLRRRIEPPDRRCYAYFHPALTDEPLIFVEVALTREVPAAIQPILSQERHLLNEKDATTAVFYSISNCQIGLRGISFGNFLIKRVVEELKRDLPKLETFVTLSPVPGFRRWLGRASDGSELSELKSERLRIAEELEDAHWSKRPETAAQLKAALVPLAAEYFLQAKNDAGEPIDPVARFHLGNGARLERINWLGDVSQHGMRQSAGLMVNYLYDLEHIEENHELFVNQRTVVASSAIKSLTRSSKSVVTR